MEGLKSVVDIGGIAAPIVLQNNSTKQYTMKKGSTKQTATQQETRGRII